VAGFTGPRFARVVADSPTLSARLRDLPGLREAALAEALAAGLDAALDDIAVRAAAALLGAALLGGGAARRRRCSAAALLGGSAARRRASGAVPAEPGAHARRPAQPGDRRHRVGGGGAAFDLLEPSPGRYAIA
jgi:hypothetical protein